MRCCSDIAIKHRQKMYKAQIPSPEEYDFRSAVPVLQSFYKNGSFRKKKKYLHNQVNVQIVPYNNHE